MKYKLEIYDEVNNIWLLKKRSTWMGIPCWTYAGCGNKDDLIEFVKVAKGVLVE